MSIRSLRKPLALVAALGATGTALVTGDDGRRRPAWAQRTRQSLRVSVFEGMAAELFGACASGAVLTAWALHLGCGPFVVGLLGALPFLAQVAQIPTARLTQRFGGRRISLWCVGLSRQVIWPLVALPFLDWSAHTKLVVLIWVASLSAVLSVMGANGWTSWMGDLVPERVRGRYFGRRTAICAFAGAVGTLAAGRLLDVARGFGREREALSLLALAAAFAGVVSWWLMAQQHEVPQTPTDEEERDRSSPMGDAAARRYVGFLAAWNLSVGATASLFTVYMVRELQMGYALVALQGIATATVRMIAAPIWGRAIDRVGARPVLVACSACIVGIPLLWLVPTPQVLWPVFVDALFSGVLWSGHNLATFQLPLSLAPPKARASYLALFSATGGVAFAIAGTLGGLLAGSLPLRTELAGHSFGALELLMLVTCALRSVAALVAFAVVEPDAQPVSSLGRLVASVLPTRSDERAGDLRRVG